MPVIATPPGQHAGPWQLTIPTDGQVTLSYRVSDGKGGFFTRTAIASAITPQVGYNYFADKFGLFRKRVNSPTAHLLTPSFSTADAAEYEEWFIGLKLLSWESYTAGTLTTSTICSGASSTYYNILTFAPDGVATLRCESGAVVTLTTSHGYTPGQRLDLRLRVPKALNATIELFARIDNGAEFLMGSGAKPTTSDFNPMKWMIGGTSSCMHGYLYYLERYRDDTPLYQFALNELTGTLVPSRHDAQVTATFVQSSDHITWRIDEADWSAPTLADDLIAVTRNGTASRNVGRRLELTGLTVPAVGVTRRYSAYVKATGLAYNNGLAGIGTTETVNFMADGSIQVKLVGMGSLETIRPVGANVLTGQKQKIDLIIAPTRFSIEVDGVEVAAKEQAGLAFIPSCFLEGSSSTTTWQGLLYNLTIYDDAAIIEQWKLDANAGTGVMANSVGTAVATLGSSCLWVNG